MIRSLIVSVSQNFLDKKEWTSELAYIRLRVFFCFVMLCVC